MNELIKYSDRKYYKIFKKEVIDVIRELLSEEEFKGYLKGNIIKYRLRAGFKTENPDEDLQKSNEYLKWLKQIDNNIDK
jgi:hypothetical protein